MLYVHVFFLSECVLLRMCVPSGWLGRSVGVSGARQAVVPGGDRELGRGLCEAEPSRCVHTGGEVHWLDPPADQRTGVTEHHTDMKQNWPNTQDQGFRPGVHLQTVVMIAWRHIQTVSFWERVHGNGPAVASSLLQTNQLPHISEHWQWLCWQAQGINLVIKVTWSLQINVRLNCGSVFTALQLWQSNSTLKGTVPPKSKIHTGISYL